MKLWIMVCECRQFLSNLEMCDQFGFQTSGLESAKHLLYFMHVFKVKCSSRPKMWLQLQLLSKQWWSNAWEGDLVCEVGLNRRGGGEIPAMLGGESSKKTSYFRFSNVATVCFDDSSAHSSLSQLHKVVQQSWSTHWLLFLPSAVQLISNIPTDDCGVLVAFTLYIH